MKNWDMHAQRGMTLVVACLLLVALLAIAALCIDLGILYTARTSAQHSADAGALAGAYTFVNNPAASQPTTAQQAAIAVAGSNKILGQNVTIAASDVAVNTSAHKVTVTVSRLGSNGVQTFFARAIGIPRVSVQAQATAQASLAASASRCVKPIYIPNTVFSTQPATDKACAANEVLFDSNGNLTAWGAAQIGQCGLIRPTDPGTAKKDIAPSQFFSLDFGSGANTYRCAWSACLNDPSCGASQSIIACSNSYPVKTGDMKGPTNQGVGDLIGPSPDTWIAPGQYETASGTVTDTSRSMATIPVWDNCNHPLDSGTAGQTAAVIGFVEVFVDGMSNQNGCTSSAKGGAKDFVKIHAINATPCSNGSGGGGGGGGTGPAAVPVQLIKN